MPDPVSIINDLRGYETEREWFEFKENWFIADELGEYICALANTAAMFGRKYAYMVWGVADRTHEMVGTSFDFHQDVKGEPLQNYISRQLSPSVNYVFEECTIDGKRLVLLTIPAAKHLPVSYKWERFIRIGSSKESLRRFPEKEIFLFHVLRDGFPTVENTESEYQDLTFTKLKLYYGAKGLALNDETFERNLSLRTEDGKYNILAQLLSDNSHILIRIGSFSGRTKSARMTDIRDFGNTCLLYSIDDLVNYGKLLNAIQPDEDNRLVSRDDIPLFNQDVYREAVINALIHNSWTSGNGPTITVFSDRIEILSRGSLAPGQTIEGFFKGESVPVNQKLAEICLQVHISERMGRGVPRIVEAYGKDVFELRENSIAVNIPFSRVGKEKKSNVKAKVQQDATSLILDSFQKNPKLTKAELVKETGLSRSKVDRTISKLQHEDLLTRRGSDRNGYWEVMS